MAEYKQNTNYNEIGPEGQEAEVEEDEEGDGGRNLGLPFGLCKKYGIALPANATPRDAWNALKNRGVNPPWTGEGQDEYNNDGKHVGDGDETVDKVNAGDEALTQLRKNVGSQASIKLKGGGLTTEYQEAFNKTLEDKDENELQMLEKVFEDGDFNYTGRGAYWHQSRNLVSLTQGTPRSVDKELGYDQPFVTAYHECGHKVAWILGRQERVIKKTPWGTTYEGYASDFCETDEMQNIFAEDAQFLFEKVLKAKGVKAGNITGTIRANQKEAYYDWIEEFTGGKWLRAKKEGRQEEKTLEEFKQSWEYSYWKTRFGEAKANKLAIQKVKNVTKQMQAYREADQKIQEFGGEEAIKANRERIAVVIDFMGASTKARLFNPDDSFYYGHIQEYYKQQPAGIELWAEYFSGKMTRDTKTLDIIKELMPKTFAKFEEVYSTMGQKVKGATII